MGVGALGRRRQGAAAGVPSAVKREGSEFYRIRGRRVRRCRLASAMCKSPYAAAATTKTSNVQELRQQEWRCSLHLQGVQPRPPGAR